MQTPKTKTSYSVTPPQKISPSSSHKLVSPRVVRQLKTSPRYSDHTAASSANLLTKPPKERDPDHEKKRPGRVSELETHISQLHKDLKIVKDHLCSTEHQKKLSQTDAEESNQHLLPLSLSLQESHKQSQLEAIREQHSRDSAALASALHEIVRFKSQLAIEAVHSESELRKLKEDMSDSLLLVQDMKIQLSDSKDSEARARVLVGETLAQLETVKNTAETLRLDGLKAMEACNAVASELDRSRARADLSEELVSKLKADISSKDSQSEVDSVKLEADQLRSALEAAELRYNDERTRSEEEMRNALEMVERVQSESGQREADLETVLRKSKYEVEEMKANLMDKETELQGLYEENEGLSLNLETILSGQRDIELENMLGKAKTEIENLRAGLMEKETEKLKSEIKDFEARDEIESARDAEREALKKLSYLREEFEKGNRKAVRVGEQLEATQAAKAEMEAELRRMKVQSEQWRKAAEAAAAMISAGNNNGQQAIERTGSMDSHYNMRSPYGDNLLDDDLMKKKNANMMRRFGVLWKKQHK